MIMKILLDFLQYIPLILLSGIILFILSLYTKSFKEKDDLIEVNLLRANRLVDSLWLLAAAFVFIVVIFVQFDIEATFLTPIGMILAALIASASVMKSIANTEKIEKNKLDREKYKNIVMLKLLLSNANSVLDKYKDVQPLQITRSEHDEERLFEIYKALADKDLLSSLSKEDQNKIMILHSYLIQIVQFLRERENYEENTDNPYTSDRGQIDVLINDFSNTSNYFINVLYENAQRTIEKLKP